MDPVPSANTQSMRESFYEDLITLQEMIATGTLKGDQREYQRTIVEKWADRNTLVYAAVAEEKSLTKEWERLNAYLSVINMTTPVCIPEEAYPQFAQFREITGGQSPIEDRVTDRIVNPIGIGTMFGTTIGTLMTGILGMTGYIANKKAKATTISRREILQMAGRYASIGALGGLGLGSLLTLGNYEAWQQQAERAQVLDDVINGMYNHDSNE